LARVIGKRYELDELIGRGGMGEVWSGWDVVLDRPIAVKHGA
jgi:eukaryotic-like serine/threonine-protein kinase